MNQDAKTEEAKPSWLSHVWLLPFSLLVVAVVFVPVRILDERGLPRYRALKAELDEITARNETLRSEVLLLQEEVNGLRDNPEVIERIARDELGMVRAGEVVFQFPN